MSRCQLRSATVWPQPADPVAVYWGHYSNTAAQLACMRPLLAAPWTFLLTLAGSELVLRTNRKQKTDSLVLTWLCDRLSCLCD